MNTQLRSTRARARGIRLPRAAAFVGLAVLLGGCLPTPVTEQGRGVFDLYGGFMVVAAIVALIVWGLGTVAIVRYRRRTVDELPSQGAGDVRLEVLWTLLPILTVIGLFIATLLVLRTVDARDPSPAVEVHAVAHRWGWSFGYAGTNVNVSGNGEPGPVVVLPVGQPVRVVLTSDDVIHAFFVPQFLFKRDAIPGRTSSFDFTIADAGTYGGQCAEFCGLYHSRMPFTVKAVAPAEYQAWLASASSSASPGPASAAPTPTGLNATEVPRPVATAAPSGTAP